MSQAKRTTLTILVGAGATAVMALLTLWRRHRRWQLQERLLASAEAPIETDTRTSTTATTTASTASTAEANARPIDSCREWGLTELAALHYSADYIFVYKQYDLHMDHASVPVTLATQMMEAYPTLADAKTAFGFRHVHQLDFATSGVLCIALNKKAASVAGKLFEKRTVSKRCPTLTLTLALSRSLSLSLTSPSTSSPHPRPPSPGTSRWSRATPRGSTCASSAAWARTPRMGAASAWRSRGSPGAPSRCPL
jgi:hypothetical protein